MVMTFEKEGKGSVHAPCRQRQSIAMSAMSGVSPYFGLSGFGEDLDDALATRDVVGEFAIVVAAIVVLGFVSVLRLFAAVALHGLDVFAGLFDVGLQLFHVVVQIVVQVRRLLAAGR